MDPLSFVKGARPTVKEAKLRLEPAVAESVATVELTVDPPDFRFSPQTMNFINGVGLTPQFVSSDTIDKVHNQNYTLHWSISFDGEAAREFATSTQHIFVSYAVGRGDALTARRMNYVTNAAKGGTTIEEITKKIVATVFTFPGFGGNRIYPDVPTSVWQNVDQSSPLDCIGLAVVAAYELAQLGVEAGWEISYPVLGGADGTNATARSSRALPQDFQTIGAPLLYYSLVYYDTSLANPAPNSFEGYLWFKLESGSKQAFTVAPPRGPIPPTTTCVIDTVGNSEYNPLSYSVFNRNLLSYTGAGDPAPGQLYWLDENGHINKAPRIGPLSFARTGCSGVDLTESPRIE